MNEGKSGVRPIIVVRRRANKKTDDHHGGVWKIAFADFMTAMMAFFLVLWIVNSTSKETQSSIARYFNPIKITDGTISPKGMKDARITDFDASLPEDTKELTQKNRSPEVSSERSSGNPYVSPNNARHLAEIPEIIQSRIAIRGTIECDYSDDTDTIPQDTATQGPLDTQLVGTRSAQAIERPFDPFNTMTRPNLLNGDHVQPSKSASDGGCTARSTDERRNYSLVANSSTIESDSRSPPRVSSLTALAADLKNDFKLNMSFSDHRDGLLISLMDTDQSSMFPVGSPSPSKSTISGVEQIGKWLQLNKGRLVVRGHTDARQFRNTGTNNWSLSAARAQAVYVILRRSGVEEHRFDRLEGHADRNLRNKNDPLAPENRRIEILIARDE